LDRGATQIRSLEFVGLARARNVLAASHTTELAARFADLARRSVAVISAGGSLISCRACWATAGGFLSNQAD